MQSWLHIQAEEQKQAMAKTLQLAKGFSALPRATSILGPKGFPRVSGLPAQVPKPIQRQTPMIHTSPGRRSLMTGVALGGIGAGGAAAVASRRK